MTGTEIVTAALGLAGNSSLDATLALGALNRFLDSVYRLKFSWQRLTASPAFTAGVAFNTAQWPSGTTFLDLYEHDDGTVGRYTDASGNVASLWGLTYRQYINIADRTTAQGQPQRIAGDPVAGRWYLYPEPDAAYTVDVDYYQKPAAIAAGDTPLWSSHAPDDVLVQAVKVWAYEWMDDGRHAEALARLSGMVGAYRRKDQAKEGIQHQTALDQRVFQRIPADD